MLIIIIILSYLTFIVNLSVCFMHLCFLLYFSFIAVFMWILCFCPAHLLHFNYFIKGALQINFIISVIVQFI